MREASIVPLQLLVCSTMSYCFNDPSTANGETFWDTQTELGSTWSTFSFDCEDTPRVVYMKLTFEFTPRRHIFLPLRSNVNSWCSREIVSTTSPRTLPYESRDGYSGIGIRFPCNGIFYITMWRSYDQRMPFEQNPATLWIGALFHSSHLTS